jgi:hypothetical protein
MKVLIISYHFPPDGVIGAVRPYRLARHLPEWGIEAWVITVAPRFAEQLNPDHPADHVPPDHILRTAMETTVRDRVLARWNRRSLRSGSEKAPEAGDQTTTRQAPKRGRILRDSVLSWLAYPDTKVGWYRPALAAAEKAHQKIGFDVVVATSPPRVGPLIAYELSRRSGVPWVMDLRDPWQMHWDRPNLVKPFVDALQRRWFGRCARSARVVVHNTERQRALTARLVPRAATACVPNGFEPDWLIATAEGDGGEFRIGYYGNIMGNRSAATFLDGFSRWLRSRATLTSATATFTGAGLDALAAQVATLGLEDVVQVRAPVPRAEVPRMMRRDYLLLLLANDQPLQVPGKAYDYLSSERRILALTERDSATADLLKDLEGCAVVSTPEDVARALDRFHAEFEASPDPRVERAAILREASYPNRVRRYAELLRSLEL